MIDSPLIITLMDQGEGHVHAFLQIGFDQNIADNDFDSAVTNARLVIGDEVCSVLLAGELKRISF